MKIWLTMLMLLTGQLLKAQTVAELTKQKKTQIKYLLEQIAAFQAYNSYVEKGIDIAHKGLTTIHDIREGEFNLHGDYFSSLKMVKPKVKSYWKVGATVALQIKIIMAYHQQHRKIAGSTGFSSGEITYINKVFTSLLDGCSQIIEHLIEITSDGHSRMKDDERIERIDRLYAEMQDRYSFLKSFSAQTDGLVQQRLQEQREINTSKALYGIH